MVHRWLLKTAYTILLSNETHDQLISCLCVILLASEWALPPSFSCIFNFWTNHFSSRKKIYWRYSPYMAFKNCLNYSPFKWNHWCINIMSPRDFISIWVNPPPSFSCIFIFWTKHFSSRKKIYWRYSPYMASKNCLYYSSFKWNPWSVNIMSLCDFISIWVSPPPSFSCIFMFRTKHLSIRIKIY